jgi:succinate dehydrogenase/fumarate reductase flavoprotein subunit
MATALFFAQSKAYAQGRWDHEADVVVVGTGAAGSSAALFASQGDSKVLLVEKGVAYGGTTGISAGVFHIPNNALMRAAGVADPREDAIRYYARTAYPAMYSAKAPNFGLFENEYNLIAAFYDNASNAIDGLVAMGALQIAPWLDFEGKGWPDYYSQLPEDKAPRGRQLVPKNLTTGEPMMSGIELLRQLRVVLDRRSVPVLLRHRATRLVLNDKRQVIGLEAITDDGQRTVAVRARKGVIFGSGGFTHNRELRMKMLRGPVFSGCGPVTNEGDLIYIAGAVGAKFTNMAHAWWHPQVLELALQTTATNLSGGNPGDGMLVVNKYGVRVVNEMKGNNIVD